MASNKQLRLIFDLDAMAFRACAAAERDTYWGEGIWSIWADEAVIEAAFDNLMEQYLGQVRSHYGSERTKQAVIVFAESIGENWRVVYEPTYKAGRRKESKINRKPLGYKFLLEQVRERYDVRHTPHYEGDDVIGILATSDCDKYENVVVALDKDFKTVPCKFLRVNTGELLEIDADQAEYNLLHQTLTGDTSDGYAGCAGIGAVTATKILNAGTDTLRQLALNEFIRAELKMTPAAFKKADLTDITLQDNIDDAYDAMERQYLLARILKSSDPCPIKTLGLVMPSN